MSVDIVRTHFASDAIEAYAEAHHQHLPNAANWEESIKPYWNKNVPFSVVLYSLLGDKPHRLAMNKKLSGMDISKIEHYDRVIMLYEVVSNTKDANGNPSTIVNLGQLNNGYQRVICYADGRSNLY